MNLSQPYAQWFDGRCVNAWLDKEVLGRQPGLVSLKNGMWMKTNDSIGLYRLCAHLTHT